MGGQVGTYKDWRGRAACLQCPDVNMITECSNFTGCPQVCILLLLLLI
jgi:hypothetical protein